MRKRKCGGKGQDITSPSITHSMYSAFMRHLERPSWLISWQKISVKASEVPPQYNVSHEELRCLIFPFFPDTKKESHKIHRKCSPRWGRLLWYLVYNSRLLKAHRNVSYHKAKLAGLKFSSAPKQLVFSFPSVLLFVMGFFLPPELNSEFIKQASSLTWDAFYFI